jgi:hypothetical protein
MLSACERASVTCHASVVSASVLIVEAVSASIPSEMWPLQATSVPLTLMEVVSAQA